MEERKLDAMFRVSKAVALVTTQKDINMFSNILFIKALDLYSIMFGLMYLNTNKQKLYYSGLLERSERKYYTLRGTNETQQLAIVEKLILIAYKHSLYSGEVSVELRTKLYELYLVI